MWSHVVLRKLDLKFTGTVLLGVIDGSKPKLFLPQDRVSCLDAKEDKY
jgi:hypothetical protein